MIDPKPVAVGGATGLGDGMLVSIDERQGRVGNMGREFTTYYRAGLIAAGVGLSYIGVDEDITTSLGIAGAALLGSRIGLAIGRGHR